MNDANTQMDDQTTDDLNNVATSTTATQANGSWLKIADDGTFECSECGHKNIPETVSADGTHESNIAEIKSRLQNAEGQEVDIPGICPVCGMEYVFRLSGEELFLEPSEMLK